MKASQGPKRPISLIEEIEETSCNGLRARFGEENQKSGKKKITLDYLHSK